MGIGLIPDRAFEVIGAGMNLLSIALRDAWARRELRIVVRDSQQLSGKQPADARPSPGREPVAFSRSEHSVSQ
jgi:hypothetical protein